jgi:hypothetical protein
LSLRLRTDQVLILIYEFNFEWLFHTCRLRRAGSHLAGHHRGAAAGAAVASWCCRFGLISTRSASSVAYAEINQPEGAAREPSKLFARGNSHGRRRDVLWVRGVTGTWKAVVALAAVVGLGTCVGLGFLWAALFIAQPATLAVLDRASSAQDVPAGDFTSLAGDVLTEGSRFLGTYHNSNYFAAPSAHDETSVCIITEPVVGLGEWEANCGRLIDGRDVLTSVRDAEGRPAVLVADQFDHGKLEAEGWVSVHGNLLVQPK